MTVTRQDLFAVTVTVNGQDTGGVWSARSGGEVDSEETLYHPGGAQAPVSLGGRRTYGALTIQRGFDPVRDGPLQRVLLAAVGSGRVVCVSQALDADGNAYSGVRLTYTGTLKTYTPPEHNAESNDAAVMQLDVTVESVA